MQKHFRAVEHSTTIKRVAKGRRIYMEALNPFFGYFYTVKKTLRETDTDYQHIELIDTDEFGRVMLLDNITQVAERNDYHYHEPMVHPVLCSHPAPYSILVIGGGDGGVLRELVKYPNVKRIELAELDEGVIEFSKKYLGPVHCKSFADPRVHVNVADGREYVRAHKGEFDIVIMDMTDPFGPSKMLYTQDFYKDVKRALRGRNGMFVMHSESPIARPSAFACIQKTLGATFNHVCPFYIYIQMYAVLWSITVSSNSVDVADVKAQSIDRKLARYGINDLKVYNGSTHASMQVAFPHIREILKKPARIITDSKPDFPDNFIS